MWKNLFILGAVVGVSHGCGLEAERLPQRLERDPHAGDATARELPRSTEVTSLLTRYIAAGESLEEQRSVTLTESGRIMSQAVLRSEGNVRLLVIDELGNAQNRQTLVQAEAAAHRRRHGFLSHALHAAIAISAPDAMVDIVVYLDAQLADPELPLVSSGISFEQWQMEYRAQKLSKVLLHSAPVEALLAAHDAEDIDLLEELAIITARIPADELLNVELNQNPHIRAIELRDDTPQELRSYGGHAAMGESAFDGCSVCLGSGQDVVVWETDGDDALPALGLHNTRFGDNSVSQQYPPQPCSVDSDCVHDPDGFSDTGFLCLQNRCVGEHPTFAAGAVGMVGSFTERGSTFARAGANAVAFHFANDSGPAGLDWALAIPSVFVNRSQGSPAPPVEGAFVAGMDAAARYDFALITQAAGNHPENQVDCSGWNTVCVGSYDYGVWNDRSDDRVSLFSGFLNPQSSNSGLERPHLVGPGNYANSTASGGSGGPMYLPSIRASTSDPARMTTFFEGFDQGNNVYPVAGTSFAAPAVLGLAVQAYLYEGSLNMAHSALRKIVLMVGARDANADGGLPGGVRWSTTTDAKDGAGAPDAGRIKAMLDGNRYRQRSLTNSSFVSCGSNCREYTVASVSVPANNVFRAGIAYYSCAGTAPLTNTLLNDLDLFVQRTCGLSTSVSSTSANSEVEMVQSFCSTSATHTIKVRIKNGAALQLCGSSTFEPVSIAWDYYPTGVIGP